jgi:hypothetical protein
VPYEEEKVDDEEMENKNKNNNDAVIKSASTYSWVACHLTTLKQLL